MPRCFATCAAIRCAPSPASRTDWDARWCVVQSALSSTAVRLAVALPRCPRRKSRKTRRFDFVAATPRPRHSESVAPQRPSRTFAIRPGTSNSVRDLAVHANIAAVRRRRSGPSRRSRDPTRPSRSPRTRTRASPASRRRIRSSARPRTIGISVVAVAERDADEVARAAAGNTRRHHRSWHDLDRDRRRARTRARRRRNTTPPTRLASVTTRSGARARAPRETARRCGTRRTST